MTAFPSLGISEMDVVQFLLAVLAVIMWKTLSALQLIGEMLLAHISFLKFVQVAV
jgi:hypothetical protein